ncbi:MAG: MarR family winged helix-turn-helix transcriptional regulator [Bulleidia sp.]
MQKKIGHMFKVISDKMKSDGDTALKEKNLTFVQSQVLRYLRMHEGRATQRELEGYFQVSHPTIVGIVSRMENNGHLYCYADTKDRRQKIVELTEAGHAVEDQIRSDIMARDRHLVEGLSDQEVDELYRMLEIVYSNLSH